MNCKFPLKIIISNENEPFQKKFAVDAYEIVEKSNRLDYEITNNGLIVRGVWESDIDKAISNVRDKYENSLIISPLEIEYKTENGLLEPVMDVVVFSPEEYMGEIMGNLNSRRGIVVAMDESNGYKKIAAIVPLPELLGYMEYLKSISSIDWDVCINFNSYKLAPNPEGTDPSEPFSQSKKA